MRIEEVEEVIINSIIVRPNDAVDFWFTNIRQNLTLTGSLNCPQCTEHLSKSNATYEKINQNVTNIRKPTLNFHAIKSGAIYINDFEKSTETDLTLKFRNADTLTIMDSYFDNMNSSTIEVFNTPTLYLMHSEFHKSSPNIIVTNAYVKNVTISDCLLEEDAVNILAHENTKVTKKCTISPIVVRPKLDPECHHSMIGRWIAINGDPSVETSGAIALALVSSFILMVVIVMLYTLHRQGKLDAYL